LTIISSKINFYVLTYILLYSCDVGCNAKVVDQPPNAVFMRDIIICCSIYSLYIIICSLVQQHYVIKTIQVLLISHHTLQIKRAIGFETNLNNDWVIRLRRFIGTMLLIYVWGCRPSMFSLHNGLAPSLFHLLPWLLYTRPLCNLSGTCVLFLSHPFCILMGAIFILSKLLYLIL